MSIHESHSCTASSARVHVQDAFTSVGCNRSPSSLSWISSVSRNSAKDLIAYGASSLIAISKSSVARVVATLRGHEPTSTANCVQWFPDGAIDLDEEHVNLVSGASDGSMIEWRLNVTSLEYEMKPLEKRHSGGILSIDIMSRSIEGRIELFLASTSTDNTVCVWKRDFAADGWMFIEQFDGDNIRTGIPLAVSIFEFKSQVFLAIGGISFKIALCGWTGSSFVSLCLLEGHEDWIRDLQFCTNDNGDGILASASQDSFIRLWKFSILREADLSFSRNVESTTAEKFQCSGLGNRGQLIVVDRERILVALESVLAGHDGWVYSVCWKPKISLKDGSTHQPMSLLSSSIDRSMVVWEYDSQADLWLITNRSGEVGGHSVGCYGAVFGPGGDQFIGHAYNGSFYTWRISDGKLHPVCSPSGHSAAVVSLCWDPASRYLLSCSEDKTSRIFAACAWSNSKDTPAVTHSGYHEIARPQVHGYEMSDVCPIPSVPFRYASGAQEKVVRVFDAPQQFLNDLHTLARCDKIEDSAVCRSMSASVPELGLSNKAVAAEKVFDRTCPPDESALAQDTLWPELAKCYGHGYEIFTLASSHDGNVLASSCASKQAEHSSVRLWSTKTWTTEQVLDLHNLTVVEMEFSPDDTYLLTVSRDRSIAVSIREDTLQYRKVWHLPKAHARIVWTCSWAPDSAFFATGSRDKKVKVWRKDEREESWTLDSHFAMSSAVTSVRFLPVLYRGHYVLAVALESGLIEVKYCVRAASSLQWLSFGFIPARMSHSGCIREIQWRPDAEASVADGLFALASAGDDWSVRISHLLLELDEKI